MKQLVITVLSICCITTTFAQLTNQECNRSVMANKIDFSINPVQKVEKILSGAIVHVIDSLKKNSSNKKILNLESVSPAVRNAFIINYENHLGSYLEQRNPNVNTHIMFPVNNLEKYINDNTSKNFLKVMVAQPSPVHFNNVGDIYLPKYNNIKGSYNNLYLLVAAADTEAKTFTNACDITTYNGMQDTIAMASYLNAGYHFLNGGNPYKYIDDFRLVKQYNTESIFVSIPDVKVYLQLIAAYNATVGVLLPKITHVNWRYAQVDYSKLNAGQLQKLANAENQFCIVWELYATTINGTKVLVEYYGDVNALCPPNNCN